MGAADCAANYKPIEARRVANALASGVPTAKGVRILLSGAMRHDA
jgi:hypothetical protein